MSYPTSIRVIRFVIHETGTYNEQYRRPYISQLTSQGMNQILENTMSAPRIHAGIFSGVANQVLAPSPEAESVINIPNGWSERRFRFMLHLEVTYKTGGVIHEIVTGWSETPASTVSLYGTLDPNTVFRVNNTIHIRQQNITTPLGIQTRSSIADCSHVLSDNNWTSINSPNRQISMRPTDIFSKIIVSNVEDQLASEGSYDASTTVTNIARKSKRTNAISTNYIADIVRSYVEADASLGVGSDAIGANDAFGIAQSYSKESSAARDPFLDTISSFSNMPVSDTFTLSQLNRIDPNADNNTVYVKMGVTEMAQVHNAGQTQHWAGSDLHTHIATILSNSVPAIMVSSTITKIAFVTTNMDATGRIDTRIADIEGIAANMDMSQPAQAFLGRLENEILNDLSQYQIGYAIQMQVDILGETWIKITIGNEEIDYVTPSFCDALTPPVITNQNQVASNLASDLYNLMSNVVDFKNNNSANIIQSFNSTGYKSIL